MKLFYGWLCFIFGTILLGSGYLLPQKTPFLILNIGIILVITGLVLISIHIKERHLKGTGQIRQILNNLGSIFLVCVIVGLGLIGYNPSLQKVSYVLIFVAIVVYIISLIFKKFPRKE